jgi:hypothetical protein
MGKEIPMRIRIKAPFNGAESSGIYGADAKEIPIGTELDFEEEPKGWAGRYDVIDAGETEGKTAIINPDDTKSAIYEVKDKGTGWFVITKDGAEVSKSLRADDVAGFDDLSAEDKAAFADLHKKDA